MKGMLAIYRRELGGYFVSPIAYTVIGFFLLASGLVFTLVLSHWLTQSSRMMAQAAQMGMPPDIDVPMMIIRSFVGFIGAY
ncbi:MAG: ABC transporter permease, partial [Blastocatellia bacterium]